MEDGQGEVVPHSSSGSPGSHLGDDLPNKALIDNMGSENQVEYFEGGDDGEIMVEVVGSDVFLDGVSGHHEGDSRSGEVADLEGHALEERQKPGVGESGDDCELHLSEPIVEKNAVRIEEPSSIFDEDCALLSKEDGILNGNHNTVIEIESVSLVVETESAIMQPESEDTTIPTVISEGIISEDVVANDPQMEAGINEKHEHGDNGEVLFTASASDENVDLLPAETTLSSAETAQEEGFQTTSSDATQNVNFVDMLDLDDGASNVSGKLSSMGKDKSFGSDVDLSASKLDDINVVVDDSVAVELNTDENQPGTTCMSDTVNEEIVSSDSAVASGTFDGSMVVSFEVTEVIDDKNLLVAVEFSKEKEELDETSKETSQQEYPTEATKSEKSEADSSKSNGTFTAEDPDSEKKLEELKGRPLFDGNMVTSEVITGEFTTEVDVYSFTAEDPDSEIKLEELKGGPLFDGNVVTSEVITGEFATEVDVYSFEENQKSLTSLNMGQSSYLSAPEKEGRFSVADLVWGKVRSHPWWPGQIFDPADASDDAVKYYKKDSYLVAYFGDQTFAWNDSSLLKPFRPYFTQMEKQSNSKAFRDAIDCALEEVSRRVELGLSCSCISQEAYSNIKTQQLINCGIRQDSSQRCGVDKSCKASHFQPAELVRFIIDLAPRSSSGADQLDLVLSLAQLSAFCHYKGYRLPSELSLSEELLENDLGTQQRNLEHTPVDASESIKERSLTDLMDWEFSVDVESDAFADDVGISVSFPVARKRKADYPLGDGSNKRSSTPAKVSAPTSQAPKASFRIGECISRVASQLTGPGSDDTHKTHELSDRPTMVASAESSSLNEMLSQIQLLALHLNEERIFPRTTRTFLLGFRNSIALSRKGRKKRYETSSGAGATEEFEFHDVNDSYWTDRIVQNFSPEELQNNEIVPFVNESVVKPNRRSHPRKRYSTTSSGYPSTESNDNEISKKRKQESSPAELILKFEESKRIPSEISLNKTFRRFGALMESETEVDHSSGRARVIFKRGCDAEVARDSSEKFKLFGPDLTVNYQVDYSPLISVKISPIVHHLPQEEESWMPVYSSL